MKAISIRPPWAWAILHAGKDIENRTWKTNYRGPMAVHASGNMSRPYYEQAVEEIKKVAPRAKVPPFEEMARSAIVGVVEIAGCEKKTGSKWHEKGNWGFVLKKPRALVKPVECNGWLGVWEVPDEVA